MQAILFYYLRDILKRDKTDKLPKYVSKEKRLEFQNSLIELQILNDSITESLEKQTFEDFQNALKKAEETYTQQKEASQKPKDSSDTPKDSKEPKEKETNDPEEESKEEEMNVDKTDD